MASKRIDVEIGVKSKLAAGLKSVRASIRNFAKGVNGALSSVGLSFKRIAAIGVGSLAAMIKHGNAFTASMAEVKTMLGSDKSMLPKLTKQVRELSGEFGLAKDTLAKGLYNALSAGVPANNAIDFLRVASKAAVGGVTDVDTAVDGLTSVLNAYGIEASKVSQVSDIMFSVVKEGKINFEELSQNIGTIAPFAKVAGVGIEDLSAMIATLVKVDKPERAMTSLRQAMVFDAESGKPLMQVLNEFEGKSLEDLLKAGVSQKSAAGIAIMSGNMSVLRKEMQIFANTAGAANDAFEDVSAVRGWQRLWQTTLSVVSRVGETIDTTLHPAINRITSAIRGMGDSPAFEGFIENVKTATENVIGFFDVMLKGGSTAVSAMSKLGDIVIYSFISGAMQAANIIGEGIGKALEFAGKKTGNKLLEMIPAVAAIKAVKAVSSGEETKSGLFDIGSVDSKRSKKIQELMDIINQSGKPENKTSTFPDVSSATGAKASEIMTKIGTGNATGAAVAAGGISADTSMLSTGDLFTMMQAGTGAKRESELSELQTINSNLETLIDLSGGVV